MPGNDPVKKQSEPNETNKEIIVSSNSTKQPIEESSDLLLIVIFIIFAIGIYAIYCKYKK